LHRETSHTWANLPKTAPSGYRQILQYLQLAGFAPEAIVIASTLIHPYRHVPSVARLLRTVELIIESGPTIRTELE
jgi:hypothetical protein